MPKPEEIEKLMKTKGNKVTVEYYSFSESHRPDDIPTIRMGNVYKMTGILNSVNSRSIIVGGVEIPFFEEDDMMKNGSGVPVGCGYITEGSGISLIVSGKRILYDNYDAIPANDFHKVRKS